MLFVKPRVFIFLIYSNLLMSSSSWTRSEKKRTKLNDSEFKIVNGVPVRIKNYPYATQFLNSLSLCGAAIIRRRVLVTAAHCFPNKDVKKMEILAGAQSTFDSFADFYKIESFVLHPAYKEGQFNYDIALLFTKQDIQFGDKVKRIQIVNHTKWMNEREHKFTAVGWGRIAEDGPLAEGLQKTYLKYVAFDKCSKMATVTKDMFCLIGNGQTDTCFGDSGGPIIWNKMLVGITSHGIGCARPIPGQYTNVWYFRKWIRKQIRLQKKRKREHKNMNLTIKLVY